MYIICSKLSNILSSKKFGSSWISQFLFTGNEVENAGAAALAGLLASDTPLHILSFESMSKSPFLSQTFSVAVFMLYLYWVHLLITSFCLNFVLIFFALHHAVAVYERICFKTLIFILHLLFLKASNLQTRDCVEDFSGQSKFLSKSGSEKDIFWIRKFSAESVNIAESFSFSLGCTWIPKPPDNLTHFVLC